MRLNYKLGDLITQRREKATGEKLPICGVTREGLIPPKQIDADTSIYNMFYRNDFIFNPARMELNSISLNDKYDKAICSSLYEIFFVTDEHIVLPEYLNLILKRDDFVRYCKFVGFGSVREYCRFANIYDYPIYLPHIERQHEIVKQYKAITDRIALKRRINDNLEATAQAIFEEMFSQYYGETLLPLGWKTTSIDKLCTVKGGKRLPTDSELIDIPTNHPYIRVRDVGLCKYVCLTNQFQYIDEETHSVISRYIVNTDDIIISIVGTIGLIGKVHNSLNGANLTENCVKLSDIHTVSSDYLYHTILYKKRIKEIELLTVGAVQAKLPMYNIQAIPVIIPAHSLLSEFQRKINIINKQLETNMVEIQSLSKMSEVLLSNLSA